MANIPPPETLTKLQIAKLMEACERFYPKEILGDDYQGYYVTTWAIPEMGLSWENSIGFFNYVSTLTKQDNIKYAYTTLIEWEKQAPETTTPEVTPEQQPAATTPQDLEKLQAEAEKAKEQKEKITAETTQRVRESIARAQEALKNKVIYVKVEEPEIPKLSDTEQKVIDELKEDAQKSPRATAQQLAAEIENRIEPSLKESMAPEEIKIISQKAAVDVVKTINSPTSYVPIATQSAILAAVANKPELVSKVVTDKTAQQVVFIASNEIAAFKILPEEITRNVLKSAFGDNFTNVVLGPDSKDLGVTISDQPIAGGTHQVNLGDLNNGYQQLQTQQNSLIDQLGSLGTNQVKSRLYEQTNSWLAGKINSLPEGAFLKSESVQTILSTFGLGKPVAFEATNWFGGLVLKLSPETAPILSGLSKLTGINFGIAPAVPSVTLATTGTTEAVIVSTGVTTTGAVAAGTVAKTGLAATLSTAFAALGSWGTPILAAISAAIGWLVGKLVEKLPRIWQWLKENAPIMAIALLGAGLFFQVPLLIGIGAVGLLGAGLAALSGARLASGLGGFFGGFRFLFTGIIGPAVIGPLIAVLIGLPILIVFILFVINSGAYLVPPKPVSDVPFEPSIECTTEKAPVSFPNLTSSPIAKRAWEITADLYQGFWCFWNRSPGDFPEDKTEYPPSYPELFDKGLFVRNPNPTGEQISICGECLFWCTWLVQKAYRENGVSIEYTLWSPTMQADFTRRGKFISASQSTPANVVPGSVVFFDVVNSLDRTDHVGIAHSINVDGVSFAQSNAGTKDGFIPFNSSGVGLQNIPGITVVGVGIP